MPKTTRKKQMLDLDSPLWAELQDAYGNARGIPGLSRGIPGLLKQLEAAPSQGVNTWTGVWNRLWESLCHGGIDIYNASYAAVPHFRRIGETASLSTTWGYLGFNANVEIFRLKGSGPQIPEFLQESYFHSLSTIHEWIFELSKQPWDFLLCSGITAVISASKGHADLGWTLLELTPDNLKSVINLLEDPTLRGGSGD